MNHDPKTCEACRKRTEAKADFPPGPWHKEPDRVDFEHAGLPCFINRNHHGCWCGYAGVPNGHPAYGKDGDELGVEVHGGLTYGHKCDGCLCHTPKSGDTDDVFWHGFDCNHAWDLCPAFWDTEGEYRDEAFAIAETKRLAEQLAAMS